MMYGILTNNLGPDSSFILSDRITTTRRAQTEKLRMNRISVVYTNFSQNNQL